MLTRYSPVGNPFRQVNHKPVVMPRRKIRVAKIGWYGLGGKPVTLGQELELPLDEARGAIALGRAVFV